MKICEIKYQNEDDSFAKNCIFMIECESNLKLYIDYANFRTVHSKVSTLILNSLSRKNKDYNSELSQSLRESKYISVSILNRSNDLKSLISLKYILIKEYDTLAPNGLNTLSLSSIKDVREKDYVRGIIAENNFYTASTNYLSNKSRKYKIAQIDRETEIAIRTWDSLSQISLETGYRQGNISACCRGKIKSAYGFCWEYIEAD